MIYIKKAKLEDCKEIAKLFDAYRVFYKLKSDIEAAELFLRERISNNESELFIAYTSSNEFTGFVQLYPIFSSTRMKRLWLLNDLFVSPEYRGQGISKLLIEKSKELCRETKACSLLLETAKTNEIGNQLYPSAGLKLDEEHNYYTWDN